MRFNDAIKGIESNLESIALNGYLPSAIEERLMSLHQSQDGVVSSEDRKMMFLQDTAAFIAIQENYHAAKAIFPVMLGGGNLHCSLDDDLKTITTAIVDKNLVGKFVLTLGNLNEVIDSKFFYLSELDHNPENANDMQGKAIEGTIPGIKKTSDNLVFVAIPAVMAFWKGDIFPEEIDLSQDALPAWVADVDVRLRVWLTGMHWIAKQNGFQSIHSNSGFFRKEEIPIQPFIDAGLQFLDSPEMSVELAAFDAKSTKEYKKTFFKKRYDLAKAIYDHNPQAYDRYEREGEPPEVNKQGETAQDIATSLAKAFATALDAKTAETERKATEKVQDSVDHYRLFLAARVPVLTEGGDTMSHRIVPATLSDSFTKVLKETKTSDAVRALHRSFKHLVAGHNNFETWQAMASLDPETFQNAAIVALQHLIWTDRSLNFNMEDAKAKLNFFSFGPSNPTDPTFLALKQANLQSQKEELMGVDPSKQSTKKTELYLPPSFDSMSHLQITIANFILFVSWAIKDFNIRNPPMIVELFNSILFQFMEPRAKDWMKSVPARHFPVSCALELDRMITVFHSVAIKQSNIFALRDEKSISTDEFRPAYQIHRRLQEHIENAISMSTLGDFSEQPLFHDYICKICSPNKEGSPKRDSSTPSSNSNNGNDSATKKQRDDPTLKGVFEFLGTGRLPAIPFKMTDKNGVEKVVCLNTLYAGRQCKRGSECTMIHVTPKLLKTHPQKDQVVQFQVDNKEKVKFTPGAKPPTG